MGIFYLLFCWTLIPLIASLIKGIMYLTMTDADFAVTYGLLGLWTGDADRLSMTDAEYQPPE